MMGFTLSYLLKEQRNNDRVYSLSLISYKSRNIMKEFTLSHLLKEQKCNDEVYSYSLSSAKRAEI